jgi:plasmid stabilization system protein ParE
MKLSFSALARDELAEAKRYYNLQQSGLGGQFQLEAEIAANRILEHPLAWQFEQAPFRRFLFNRFPYKFLYIVENDSIVIIAVAHQHRHPDYWVDRIHSE